MCGFGYVPGENQGHFLRRELLREEKSMEARYPIEELEEKEATVVPFRESKKQSNTHHEDHGHHSYHSHHGSHHRSHKKAKPKNKALQVTLIVLLCVAILIVFGLVTFMVIRHLGNRNLEKAATTQVPVMMTTEMAEEETESEEILKEGQIIYKGQKYQYNKDMRTFVIMGIDTMMTVDKKISDENNGGQSDMNFLAMLNPHTKKIQMIAINRNTMTNINRYTADGEYVDTVKGQLTLQHTYGSGGADSCEMMVSAIDNIMYMIPIHGYFSMNMGAIEKLNDAVGGIELTAIEDIKHGKTDIRAGEKVVLMGRDAFMYTKYRDTKVEKSSDMRLKRQKQYLSAFVNKTKNMIKEDPSIPLKLYDIIANYYVTDISMDKVTYLATMAAGYSFSQDEIYTIPGTTVAGEENENGVYDEFYVDEEALYEMIVDLFYEPVEE